MANAGRSGVRVPPRWFVRLAWVIHRALFRLTGGRFGLWRPKPGGWGALRLTTTGRRTGRARSVIVGYLEEGPDLVLLAMNGWGEGDPAWWINLRAEPEATVQLIDGTRSVRARVATGEERERLWGRWHVLSAELDEFAALRSTETAVVVLEPRPDSGPER